MFYATISHILSQLFCIVFQFFGLVIVTDLFLNYTDYIEGPGKMYLHLAVLLAKEFSEKIPTNEVSYVNTLKQKLCSEIVLLVAVATHSISLNKIHFLYNSSL